MKWSTRQSTRRRRSSQTGPGGKGEGGQGMRGPALRPSLPHSAFHFPFPPHHLCGCRHARTRFQYGPKRCGHTRSTDAAQPLQQEPRRGRPPRPAPASAVLLYRLLRGHSLSRLDEVGDGRGGGADDGGLLVEQAVGEPRPVLLAVVGQTWREVTSMGVTPGVLSWVTTPLSWPSCQKHAERPHCCPTALVVAAGQLPSILAHPLSPYSPLLPAPPPLSLR